MTDVVKRYKNTVALDHFSMSVKKGEVLGLLGPNGAGKSTAIRVLCRLTDADAGQISLFGAPAKGQALAQKRRIGLVPQDLALYESLSARENLHYFGRLYDVPPPRRRERAEELLELLGLADVAKKACKKFSGGMKRRLNIGCALMHAPELLILDEPTVGVDPQSRNHILEFVERSARDGMTVLYTSHYMEEVERIATRVVIMDAGRVIAGGTSEELTRQMLFEDTLTVELKAPAPALTDSLKAVQGVRQITPEGRNLTVTSDANAFNLSRILELCMPFGVTGVYSHKPTLEDVFLSLTGKKLRDGEER
jgi:ABC-2 type transport system ATP-binding protein